MIIKEKHRLSVEKINAPFRGVTSREDFTNANAAIVHDLIYNQRISGYKDGVRGHKQQEEDNFSLIYHGEGYNATSSLPSAGKYIKANENLLISSNLIDTNWTTFNATKTLVGENKIQLSSNGLLDPAYISSQLEVNPGDIIYLRFKLKKILGNADSVYIGVDIINNNDSDLKRFNLTKNNTSQYYDKRLYCRSKETLTIKIYIHKDPEKLEPTTIELEDFSIQYLTETEVSLSGIDKAMKINLNEIEQKLEFLNRYDLEVK